MAASEEWSIGSEREFGSSTSREDGIKKRGTGDEVCRERKTKKEKKVIVVVREGRLPVTRSAVGILGKRWW